ncbi:MAG: hypothetical protein ACI9UA_005169 [Pseudoalteromonas tetraodonis]
MHEFSELVSHDTIPASIKSMFSKIIARLTKTQRNPCSDWPELPVETLSGELGDSILAITSDKAREFIRAHARVAILGIAHAVRLDASATDEPSPLRVLAMLWHGGEGSS